MDECIVPVRGTPSRPCVNTTLARQLFDFEPDDVLLVTENVFRAHRHFEYFVSVPARRQSGGTRDAYRPLGRKRPSAFDHATVSEGTSFVGRMQELQRLDVVLCQNESASRSIVITSPAGAAKTRLLNAWLRCRPRVRSLRASFSNFGGDLAALAAQLVELPDEELTSEWPVSRVWRRVRDEQVNVLVLDNLHWTDEPSWGFLRALQDTRPQAGLLTPFCTRPSAVPRVAYLWPDATMHLLPLQAEETSELAQRLGVTPPVARAAVR